MSKIDLSPEALQKRREIAEKATPGPWVKDDIWIVNAVQVYREVKLPFTSHNIDIARAMDADLAHIAANSPDAVIAMIDEIERLRLIVAAQDGKLNKLAQDFKRLEIERDLHRQVSRDFKRISNNLANEIDEYDKVFDEEVASYEKQLDWLAENASRLEELLSRVYSTKICSAMQWREAARKAVEVENGSN